MIKKTSIKTHLGEMIAGATDEGICLLEFTDRRMLPTEYKDLVRLLKMDMENTAGSVMGNCVAPTININGRTQASETPKRNPNSIFFP